MLSLCQYLVLQSWADLNPLLQKHGLIGEGHWFDERELRHDRQTTFNTLEHTVRTARPEAVLRMLSEIVRTRGNLRNRVTPRYLHDERWDDLLIWLALDGYRVADGNLVEAEPAIEGAIAVEDDLTAELSRSALPERDDIVNLVNRSADAFRQGNMNACLNDARIALQTLVTAISRRRPERPAGLDETRWGQVLAHLRTSRFVNETEEQLIGKVFSFVSPGAHMHIGLSDAEMARLGRSLCATMCYFLTKRYNA